jgi:hypothetical protein
MRDVRKAAWTRVLWWVIALPLCDLGAAHGQSFSSGSNGSDGALALTTPGVIDFDPVALGLDADGDNVYHFTTLTIAAGVTVRLRADRLHGPVVWLATGAVAIDGIVDLDGEQGTGLSPTGLPLPSLPGPGGYPGGVSGQAGSGPYGGTPWFSYPFCIVQGNGGGGPRNSFLVPLLGGSGGGASQGLGGGAGGGALLIASSSSVVVNGTITARGGNSQTEHGASAGGGGGGIRIVAPAIGGSGTLDVTGGGWPGQLPGCTTGLAGAGESGVIRLEALDHQFSGQAVRGAIKATPFGLFLPTTPAPFIRAVSVAGIPVPPYPSASFEFPDVTLDRVAAVTVVIESRYVPPGTVVRLHVYSENGPGQIIESTPLAGTLAQSTATASVVLPPGFSRGYVEAKWMP